MIGLCLWTSPGLLKADGFGTFSLADAQASFVGEGANEQAGWACAFAGDVNADGYDDLLIGAQLNDQGGRDAGKVYLLLGRPGDFEPVDAQGNYDLSLAEGTYVGESDEDYAGSALAPAGDLDGDGFDDFLIGAWGYGGSAGRVYIIYGQSDPPGEILLEDVSSTLTGEDTGDLAGYAIAAAGDVDGDGYDDILIGAPRNDSGDNNAGRVYLWRGGPRRLTTNHDLGDAPYILQGAQEGIHFGWSVSGAIDLDGDNRSELLIGAYEYDGEDADGNTAENIGAAYLFSSRDLVEGLTTSDSALTLITGTEGGQEIGTTVELLPDVDGDAIGDVFLGAPQISTYELRAGAAVLISGPDALVGGWVTIEIGDFIDGNLAYDGTGTQAISPGDLDRDGLADLLVSAPYADVDEYGEVGKTAFFRGSPLHEDRLFSDTEDLFVGTLSAGLAGFSVAGRGDMDGDGHPDILIGAAGAGHAYLIRSGLYFDDDGDGLSEDEGDCDDTHADAYPGGVEIPYDGIDQNCDGFDDDDLDGDGYASTAAGGEDCDDGDADVHPDATEVSDGVDQDCDGIIDNNTSAYDDDGDGFSEDQGDCDDADPAIAPDADEIDNEIDDDCDGQIDEDLPTTDDDGDGITDDQGDCDDTDPASYPGAEENMDGTDNDCDGQIDESPSPNDADGDGFTPEQGDWDDSDPASYPGADEIPDGVDNDGDGQIDEGTEDNDGDGFSPAEGDTDDTDPSVYPGADEIPDGIDNDGDGQIDEDLDGDGFTLEEGDPDDSDPATYPGADEIPDGVDNDGDGLIDEGYTDADGDGFSPAEGDTDDTDPSVYPGADEIPDGIDNDGDGQIDEDTQDNDNDGFSPAQGDPDDSDPTTYPGADDVADGIDNDGDGQIDEDTLDQDGDGFTPLEGDSDDADPATYPGADEIPDGIDNDGDGEIDEGTTDLDGDGFSPAQGDCDDSDPGIHPDADETIDGIDQDCDGAVDEDTTVSDDDGDGFSEIDDDCDDASSTSYPGAPELCDGIDNDCDGAIDNDCGDDSSSGDDSASGDDDSTSQGGDGSSSGDDSASGDDDSTSQGGDGSSSDDDSASGDDDSTSQGGDDSGEGGHGTPTDEEGRPLDLNHGCGCTHPSNGSTKGDAWIFFLTLCTLSHRRLRRAAARGGHRARVL